MTKRMVSAHAYGGESREDLKRAITRGKSFDVMVTDPLVLGIGAFDVQDLDDTIILKVSDITKKNWMVFLEREGTKVILREE